MKYRQHGLIQVTLLCTAESVPTASVIQFSDDNVTSHDSLPVRL